MNNVFSRGLVLDREVFSIFLLWCGRGSIVMTVVSWYTDTAGSERRVLGATVPTSRSMGTDLMCMMREPKSQATFYWR